MAVATAAITARYDAQTLAELTGVRDTTQTTYDSTKLTQAATDAASDFEDYAQQTYDSTNNKHVMLGVELTIALLFKYGAKSTRIAHVEWENVIAKCRDYASVSSRARWAPDSDSDLTPSTEVSSGETVRPWSDRANFRGLTPGTTGPLDDDE